MFPVLTAMGAHGLALELATSTALPSYGYQVANGGTTLWEDWSGVDDSSDGPGGGGGSGPSHNHHFMGGIGQWLHTDLAGLSQGSGVAYSHPEIWPKIVNHTTLPSASGVWQTPRGELATSWAYAQRSKLMTLNVSTPPNTVATVVFPCSVGGGGGGDGGGAITESGSAVWGPGGFKPGAAVGVTSGGLRAGLAAFTCDGGGSFVFRGTCA